MSAHVHRNDEELLTLLAQGNEGAFTEIYNRYWKKLFVIAAGRINSLEEAEEIVQDIFTKLWMRRANLNVTAGLSGYLAVSVKYRVIKALDKYYNHQRYIDTVMNDEVDDSTQEQLAFDELKHELAYYVARLPEKCRLVFQLSREEGYSQKQIAEELSISEKTVEAHLGKAFKTLRTKLASLMVTLL